MPGTTIDQFDIGIYIQYARRTELVEQVRQQLHMREATGVPAEALIVDLYPKLTELDLLFGVAALHAPWAFFYPPRRYSLQRRSPFTFHRILPTLGSELESEGELEMLEKVECTTAEEVQEKGAIKACLAKIKDLNELLRYIGGRIGQFLQG